MENFGKMLVEATESDKSIFVSTSPEVLDFTDPDARCELIIHSSKNIITATLTPQNLCLVASMLKVSVFAKGIKIIAWNWKSLLSYLWAKTKQEYLVEGSVIDLQIIEAYAGIKQKAPNSLIEAFNRLKNLVQQGIWKEIQPIYQKIHLPLIQTVAAMEIEGLLDTEIRQKVHAYYEINGQLNGRLRSSLEYKAGFLPHGLSEITKKVLKPKGLDELFMYFDIKNMEVVMLQWLSKDERLGEVLKADDVYAELYRVITGIENFDKENKKIAKKMFLPVIYGQSAYTLSHRLKIALPTAEQIVSRIKGLFSTAIAYVESYPLQLQQAGFCKDIFGKRRLKFEEDYEALNFSVKAPASLVCLEKLNQLYLALKGITNLAYSVHDGYCTFASKDNWKRVFQIGHEVLTSESTLCPGLRFKITCSAGRNLDALKPLVKGTQ